ncbi:MAG: FHA domain-containing protein [Dermatophilaceae bacterium]|nr:FHA domain-containing protein [Actinomycetales bacterium]MBP8881420.1 FHA domain-containing protein [Dermatophilaceae bacterium]MBP9919146.1 FHA domain-containing protein [Dermatophilaceae bacterium]
MPANPVVFWTPRPVLGRLVSSNGDVFVLDRGLILGRAPSIPEGHLGDPPNLVKLVDPSLELSSQHLEIRLDHWLVLAVDLGSTNGSDVIIPGREPVRLVAGVPEMLEPGAVVSLADVLTLTYEVW